MSTHVKETKQEQKNLFIAMVLVVVILFGFDFFVPSNSENKVEVPVQAPTPVEVVTQNEALVPENNENVVFSVNKVQNIALENSFLSGSITSSGSLNALELTDYKETTAVDSPNIHLLKPETYWTTLFWTSPNAIMPQADEGWQVIGDKLTPYSPLKLFYENSDVKIERTVSMDDAYMFTMTDVVTNRKSAPISVSLVGQINRHINPASLKASVIHEGFLSLIGGKLVEKDYSDIEDDNFSNKATDGWVGITDKYWQSVMVFDSSLKDVDVSFSRHENLYTAGFQTVGESIDPNTTLTRTTRLFAGAKKLDLINTYEKELNIPKFDLSIDFGWFYFLTRPFLVFLNWLYAIVGNMGIAILIFATLIRIAMLPIATKSYESMAKMRKIQPRMKMLQERYKNNRIMLQQEIMNLYKREKINPAGGCLPMLLQIPVFYALYKVLSVSINMRQAPFFGWIHDLSMPDPSSVFTAFGYLDWPIPSFLNIGIWPVLMGLTMYIQQKLNPAPTDKDQANMFKMLPIIFTFMLGNFAAGLVIYWTWSNVLSIAQQKYIMKKVGV
ncbi:MAG: membrane protein insertase YidC [Alphaproteobacteria bacterium]|nr:membrane protein insertase YidC [Alphaproteobacteria bacterium]